MVEASEKRKVSLILGGSSFMGLSLLRELASNPDDAVIFCNRGKKYWGGESFKIQEQNKLNVIHVKADRKKSGKYISKILSALDSNFPQTKQFYISQVADFCCFNEDDASVGTELAKTLASKQQESFIYTFISTDSIYDASHYIIDAHKS
jgi:hypothetical protein